MDVAPTTEFAAANSENADREVVAPDDDSVMSAHAAEHRLESEIIRPVKASEVFVSPSNTNELYAQHPRAAEYAERLSVLSSQPAAQHDRLLRLAMVGDAAVGKTSYLLRLTENSLTGAEQSTTAADFRVLQRGVCDPASDEPPRCIKIHFWDTTGSERVQPLFPAFYGDRDGFIVAFDVSDRCSFLHVPFWIREVRRHSARADAAIVLVGMKEDRPWRKESISSTAADRSGVEEASAAGNDVYEDDEGCPENFGPLPRIARYRQVRREEAAAMARRYSVSYVECSAKDGQHIDDALATLVLHVLQRGENAPAATTITRGRRSCTVS